MPKSGRYGLFLKKYFLNEYFGFKKMDILNEYYGFKKNEYLCWISILVLLKMNICFEWMIFKKEDSEPYICPFIEILNNFP